MPTYEYQCPDCGCVFEEFQPITAKPIRKCRQCGKNRVQRLIGCGAGVIFKGSGFYQTDYRSESYKQAAKAENQAPTSSKTGDAEKSPAPNHKNHAPSTNNPTPT